MPSLTPFRIRERLRSFFSSNIGNENLQVMEEKLQPLEIPETDDYLTIPEKLSFQQFPQKDLVKGVEELLPTIFATQGEDDWLFVAITLLESVEETEAKFLFPLEMQESVTSLILLWAQAYQEKNYMLPPLMAKVYWGIVPQ